MPQLRQNIITGDWVVIAPERAKRPTDFVTAGMVRRDHKDDCVFCIGAAAWQSRLTGAHNESDHTYVIRNKYPAFVETEGECERRSFPIEDFYLSKAAIGGHEVVILKDHELTLPHFSQAVMLDVLTMLQSRYHHYAKADCRPEYIMGIYNYGQEAGASIWHPHAQVFASAIVPNLLSKETEGAEHYFETNGACVFCDVVIHEQKAKARIQIENASFTSFTFYAARFPFELWIVPKKHTSRFEDATHTELADLAEVLRGLLSRLEQTLNNPPLNIFIHTAPTMIGNSPAFHWHIEIAPRVATYGGFELGGSTIIDVVSPEKAAQFLRGEDA